jgi:beta-glucanase (GH16 family)
MSRRSVVFPTVVGVLATVVVSLGTMAPASAAGPAKPGAKSSECGGVIPRKADGSRWTCTFSDEFSGSSLNSKKWMVATTASTGFATRETCYVNSPNNVQVRNGALNLIARTGSNTFTCDRGSADFDTARTGGVVTSYGRFTQAYGRFDFRAKYPATRLPGFDGNLWLYPQTLTYGAWPASGEIDVAEHWSGHGDLVVPGIHYAGSTRDDIAWTCTVNDVTQYHTYSVEWEPTEMRFSFDGQLCFKRSWTPSDPLESPQPFDKPFYILLSQGFGDPYYEFAPDLPSAGTMAVDWVRVYR